MPEGLSIYIHIPFCVRKCLYCDFLSGPFSENDRTIYIKALKNEIKQMGELYKERIITSVFFGGGTPSVLSGEDMISIMDSLHQSFVFADDCEITMEMNPGTVDEEKVKGYVKAGINRVSLGLQSAVESELRNLGRIHNPQDFLYAYKLVTDNGIHNVNVDLMSGIPGQTLENLCYSLGFVTGLVPRPAHISVYSLIVEEGTPFYDMELRLPDEDTEREMYEKTRLVLKEQGYERYEISNYSLIGFECRHNKVYWEREDYVGLGIGAASMVNSVRWKNVSNLKEYVDIYGDIDDFESSLDDYMKNKEEIAELSVKEQMEEFMFLGLRLMDGVSEVKFRENFGTDFPKKYVDVIDRYCKMGLLRKEKDSIKFTNEGINVSNVILSEFLF